MTRITLVRTVLAVLTSVGLLAGCGGTSQPPHGMGAATEQGMHNDADVAFSMRMIPHHAQAVEMAQLARQRTGNPKVLDLADRIERAQGPEIETMATWLKARGAHVPPAADPDHAMPGMMPHGQMVQLGQARDAEFDTLWLAAMIEHHEGAIDMANTELSQGRDDQIRQLASQIVATQQAEITEMRGLLPQG